MKVINRFVRSTAAKVVLAVSASVAISVPAAVWAVGGGFTDVPTSHPFYSEINAVANAGIAQGFDDGSYRPGNNITRQAMAAFMERGVGRAASGGGREVVFNAEPLEVGTVAIDPGATGSGDGFVVVTAAVMAHSREGGICPCNLALDLVDRNFTLASTLLQVPSLPNGDVAYESATLQTVVAVPGGSPQSYRVVARPLGTPTGTPWVEVFSSLTALYVPLSGDGDNTAAYELTCPKDDAWENNESVSGATRYYFASAAQLWAIACKDDPDFYRGGVQAGWTLNVDVSFSESGGDIDVCVYHDEALLQCAQGSGNGHSLQLVAATAGSYSVEVSLTTDAGPTAGNTYLLQAWVSPPAS